MLRLYGTEMSHLVTWGFEFTDGKPRKVGMWSTPGVCNHTKAWAVDKTNLACAFIQTKNIITREIKPKVVVAGQDYMNFQWVAASGFKVMSKNPYGKLPSAIVGISVLTRYKKITVFIDGRIDERDIYEHEKNQNLVGFGR